MDSLIPKIDHPFFIVTPPYTRLSAGVSVLYLLCHYLNASGERAYIVNFPSEGRAARSLPNDVTMQSYAEYPGSMIAPPITQDAIDFYHSRKITPIVLYPEVFDNPLSAAFFGRYILNYPGKSNVNLYSQAAAFSIAYARSVGEFCNELYPQHPAISDVLFIPTADLRFWNRKDQVEPRHGTCFYAGKMKGIHGKQPANVPRGSTEILRSTDMTADEVKRIFLRSTAFYCYEDTALAIEAQLCGCPTVFVPNELFTGIPLAAAELGVDGSCIFGEQNGLERATNTVGQIEAIIRRYIERTPALIGKFAQSWKAVAAQQPYRGTIDYPFEPRMVFLPKSDHAASAGFLPPRQTIDDAMIRRIAREVWWEKRRQGLPYKIAKFFKATTRKIVG